MRLPTTIAVVAVVGPGSLAWAGPPDGIDPVTVHVFHDDRIHFSPDEPSRYATPTVSALDDGRQIARTVAVSPPPGPLRVIARVTVHPIPKDAESVHDKWDRAGNVQLLLPGSPPLEVVKFVTAYGGRTESVMDVTHLAPLLRGRCTFRAFIDTWVTPAWAIDFALEFEPRPDEPMPDWVESWAGEDPGPPDRIRSLIYEPDVTRERMDEGPLAAEITIPGGTVRAVLQYLASGHCTDGRGADEFEPKEHTILVDGAEVRRLTPWRDDCREFRDRNPYCRRWYDGSWSSDFDRSGWCPSDAVEPVAIDLTDSLDPGRHDLEVMIEDIRPKDESGQGYWRISAYLLEWDEPLPLGEPSGASAHGADG